PGCLIVVSHDRYFMDKIVDHLFVFKGNGHIEDFPGNYSDFRAYENSKVLAEREAKNNASDKVGKTAWKEKDDSRKLTYQEQKEHKQLEKEIQKLEEQKATLQNQFLDPELSGDDIAKLSVELNEITDQIETKTERWFELSAILEG
ncbi:MAG: ABC transporter ATP-binding protein, partial [Allomuricauda sp.]